MAAIYVRTPGLQTTVQDLGRWGLQAYGVSPSGPMDAASHRTANALVGNAPDFATLEVTLVGPELEFDDDRVVAVSGARFGLFCDDGIFPMDEAVPVHRGGRLRFGERQSGARAYLAVEGGIMSLPVFGSRATHLASRMGGIDGRPLIAGDRIPLANRKLRSGPDPMRNAHVVSALSRTVASRLKVQTTEDNASAGRLHASVRVLSGPHLDRFDREALDAFQSRAYVVTPKSDRMGFRLSGPAIGSHSNSSMISEATPIGSVQVPASGDPILLMADRQTIGGYPILASVITADISIAGQLAPGDSISFEVVSPPEAMAALVAQERALMAIEAGRS